jgi:fermentation-respiration switch protein FrsA (DUF1100 family)
VLAIAVPVILLATYFGISAYTIDRLSRPERHALTSTPAEYGMTYEDVSFKSAVDDIPLSGWYIDSHGDKVIVMMHGRNGVRDGGEAMEIASRLYNRGYDLFMFDFRAHGASGGDRYAMGAWETRDVTGALNYLKERRGISEVGAYATSMGAATMLLAAAEHPEIKVMLADSPFADLPVLLDVQLPQKSGLPGFFNPGIYWMGNLFFGLDMSNVKPVEVMGKLEDRPIFLVHNEGDETIPVDNAYQLENAASGNRTFSLWVTPGEEHCKSFRDFKEEYATKMLQFFDTYMK